MFDKIGLALKDIINIGKSEHVNQVYSCSVCGRLHWPSGRLVFDQFGDGIFCVNGSIIHRGDGPIDPEGALRILKRENLIEALRKCPTVEERYERLMRFFPESIFWEIMESRRLVYQLYTEHSLDFGVCRYYTFEGNEQYCSATGIKGICTCAIPQKDCVIRSRHDRILDSS